MTAAVRDPDEIALGPFVSHVTHESGTISWIGPPDTEIPSVEVQKADTTTWKDVSVTTDVPGFQTLDGPVDHVRHTAPVSGLTAHSAYRYRIPVSEGAYTTPGRFRTAPRPDSDEPVTFLVSSDVHAAHDPMAAAMANAEADFVLLTGDLTRGYGYHWEHWQTFFDSARPYLETKTFWPIPGGHDISHDTAENFRLLFGFERHGTTTGEPGRRGTWYQIRYGDVAVFALDTIYDIDVQYNWLTEALPTCDARWKIVAFHDSILQAGSYGEILPVEWDGGGTFDAERFVRLFAEHGVDLAVSGDHHIYERTRPIDGGGRTPTTFVCTHGGSNHRVVRPSPIIAGGIGQQAHVFGSVTADRNTLTFTAERADGAQIDHFSRAHSQNGRYQPEVMARAIPVERARELAHVFTGQDMTHDLRYARRDVKARFLEFPVDDEPVDVELDVSTIPDDCVLRIHETDDSTAWRTETQDVSIDGEVARITIRAPASLGTTNSTFIPTVEGGPNITDPQPEFRATLRDNDRSYDPVTLRPSFGVGFGDDS